VLCEKYFALCALPDQSYGGILCHHIAKVPLLADNFYVICFERVLVVEINIYVRLVPVFQLKAVAGLFWLIVTRIEATNALVATDLDTCLNNALGDCLAKANSLWKLLDQKPIIIVLELVFDQITDVADHIFSEPASPLILYCDSW